MTACRVCTAPFEPRRPLQAVCSPRCAMRHVRAEKTALKRQIRARREAAKPRAKWLQEAQAAFNAYVRRRDAHLPCVSCGRMHDGQWHAGHYLSTGARPELRFDERNVWRQCAPCNTHLHGNLVLYRVELIERIGLAEVERLEGPHHPAKWTIDDLRAIRDDYRRKMKEMA